MAASPVNQMEEKSLDHAVSTSDFFSLFSEMQHCAFPQREEEDKDEDPVPQAQM